MSSSSGESRRLVPSDPEAWIVGAGSNGLPLYSSLTLSRAFALQSVNEFYQPRVVLAASNVYLPILVSRQMEIIFGNFPEFNLFLVHGRVTRSSFSISSRVMAIRDSSHFFVMCGF
jgi:hypothetical protein